MRGIVENLGTFNPLQEKREAAPRHGKVWKLISRPRIPG